MDNNIDEFELYLKKQMTEIRNDEQYTKSKFHPEDSKILKADKNASLFDLIKMIKKVVSISMKDLNVEFCSDRKNVIIDNPDFKLEHPMIIYKTIVRKPKDKDGFKPRIREIIYDDTHQQRIGEMWGQKFQCFVQFDIFASVNNMAEEVMDRFEELMLMYTGSFKRNGISEFFFHQQFTDDRLDEYRQDISIRSIQYYVEVEKITPLYYNKIQEIDLNINDNESEEF